MGGSIVPVFMFAYFYMKMQLLPTGLSGSSCSFERDCASTVGVGLHCGGCGTWAAGRAHTEMLSVPYCPVSSQGFH